MTVSAVIMPENNDDTIINNGFSGITHTNWMFTFLLKFNDPESYPCVDNSVGLVLRAKSLRCCRREFVPESFVGRAVGQTKIPQQVIAEFNEFI